MQTIRRVIAATLVAAGFLAAGALRAEIFPAGRVRAPEIPAGVHWLNSEPRAMVALKGKVVMVDFWEYTCVNCIHTLPYVRAWNDKYKDKGLVIIGVHTPEFQFAKEDANVEKAVKQFSLTYPIIVDSDYAVWNAYQNQYWPAKYLIDARGFIRYYHFGEGSYENTEAAIQELLKEANPMVELPPLGGPVRGADRPGAVCYPVTPELYVGAMRGQATLGNKEGNKVEEIVSYHAGGNWQDGLVYANGTWYDTSEALISTRATDTPSDYIGIKYHALEANAVLKPEKGKPIKVYILQDEKPVAEADKGTDIKFDDKGKSYILVDQPRMYNLVRNARFGQRTLKLAPKEPGLGAYSFTFVSCEVNRSPVREKN